MAAAASRAATLNTPRTAVRSAPRSICVARQSEVERRCVGVGPGGEVQERPGGVLDQQGEDEVGEQPSAGERLALRRQPVEPEQAFEPLEGKFHLPAQAVRPQHLSCGHCGGQRGDQHQVAGRPHGERLQRPVRAAPVLPAVLRFGGPRRRLRREAEDDEARREHRVAARLAALAGVVHRDRPLGDLADRQVAEDPLPGQRRPVRAQQAQPGPAGADDEVGPGRQELPQRRRAGIATVAERHVACLPGGAPEALGGALVGEVEIGEAAGDRVVGGVQPPPRQRAARGRRGGCRRPAEQRAGDLAQPARGLAQPVHHRRVGQLRQAADPGPGRGHAQRQPARAVGQRQPQQRLGAADLPASDERPAGPGRRFQVDRGRDRRDQVRPLRVERGECGLHPHLGSQVDAPPQA